MKTKAILKDKFKRVTIIFSALLMMCNFYFTVGFLSDIDPVFAQDMGETIVTGEPDITDFPIIRISLKVLDGDKRPIRGLSKEELRVIEDGKSIQIENLSERYQGIHFLLAINADTSLDKRDTKGISIYTYLLDHILPWQNQFNASEQDSWSLTLNQEKQYLQITEKQAWASALQAYQPNMRSAKSNLNSLTQAIEAATPTETGQDQILLYITPEPKVEDIETLNELTEIAIRKNLKVNIWMVGSEEIINTERGKTLFALSQRTGGFFYVYSTENSLPDINGYINNYGYRYNLSYTSKIFETGTHTIIITAKAGEKEIRSNEISIELSISPAEVYFLSPPFVIQYDPNQSENYQPSNQSSATITVRIEFVDGVSRSLIKSQLFVNDILVDENEEPPFEQFSWNYGDIVEDSISVLEVKVLDIFGIESISAELPIKIDIAETITEEVTHKRNGNQWLLYSLIGLLIVSSLIFFTVRLVKKKLSKNT